jgi:hypothetical protein
VITNGQEHGVDADPARRPGVPMEKKGRPIPGGNLSPVGASTLPWRGLSGVLRRAAYKMPQWKARHWLLLLFADRVDVVESAVRDVAKFPKRGKGTVLALLGSALGATLLIRARRA